MSTGYYPPNRSISRHYEEPIEAKSKATPKASRKDKLVTISNSKKPKINRYIPKYGEGIDKLVKYADEVDVLIYKGLMEQYCVKGSDVILRPIYFNRNDNSKTLAITVDNGRQQTENYIILFTKDICPYNFKDNTAFVIKALDNKQQIKSMTCKTNTKEEKISWLKTYGINLDIAQKLLDNCIEEIEKRRFHFGIKKRNEDRDKIKVSPEMLIELVNFMKVSNKINLTDNDQWSVTSLERLIQTLLNELVEPIIPYNNQRLIRKPNSKGFLPADETRRLLSNLPDRNTMILTSLLGHMERLSKYYLILMSSPRRDLPHIRRNICQRLGPIIFRLQEDLDGETIVNRACDVLYHTMLCVNGASEFSEI